MTYRTISNIPRRPRDSRVSLLGQWWSRRGRLGLRALPLDSCDEVYDIDDNVRDDERQDRLQDDMHRLSPPTGGVVVVG